MKGVSYTASSCSEGGEGQGAESQCVSWGFLSLLKGVPYMVSSWGGVWLGRGGGEQCVSWGFLSLEVSHTRVPAQGQVGTRGGG